MTAPRFVNLLNPGHTDSPQKVSSDERKRASLGTFEQELARSKARKKVENELYRAAHGRRTLALRRSLSLVQARIESIERAYRQALPELRLKRDRLEREIAE